MPLQPNIIERYLVNRGSIPGPLMDVAIPAFKFWSMIAAMETGFFEALDGKSCSIEELAEETNCSEEGIENLVKVMEPLGYIKSENGRYELSKAAQRSLPIDLLKDMAPFFKSQMQEYENVAHAIREAPEEGICGWDVVKSGKIGRSYQTTMRWLASTTVDEVVGKIDIPDDAEKMLDVGGSHGLYTLKFCRKYPKLEGTILDWPIGLEEAQTTLDENPDVADRIKLIERDFEQEELPEGHDFAFLGNIIHGIDPEGNRELFQKLSRATTANGTVAILDQVGGVQGSKFARGIAALAGFNLFLFSGGKSYSYNRIKDWFRDAGFTKFDQKKLKQPGFSLVVAQKA